MNICQKLSALFISAVMLLEMGASTVAAADVETVANLFTGEASAEAWYAAVTVNAPDPSLFCEENMVRIAWEGTEAPVFVLASWTGGEEWAMVNPSARIDGDLYYSYEDMTAAFGTDMSLLNSVSVMAMNAPITVYEVDVVTAESVKNAQGGTSSEQRVVGYLPDWSYGAYREMDFSALTHINIAFCNPDTEGNLSCYIPDSELHAIVDKAHANGVKVLAALGGGGGCDNYPALVDTQEERNAFNENIMEYCETYNLDGIDLDIELGSDSSIWDHYGTWCRELRSLCDERELLMTTATAQWVAVRVSDETFAYFDFINVMAYDNDGSTQSHASYDFAVECLNYFHVNRGIARDRLVLGVPFYGRGYNADGSLNWNSYVAFSELVAADTANYTADVYNGVAYNGAVTMREKCALARDYGGIMIWEVSQDAESEYSLLRVIKEEILTQTLTGDVNLDGAVDVLDAILLQKYLLSVNGLQQAQFAAADLTADGSVNGFDLSWLKKHLAA